MEVSRFGWTVYDVVLALNSTGPILFGMLVCWILSLSTSLEHLRPVDDMRKLVCCVVLRDTQPNAKWRSNRAKFYLSVT